MSVNTSAVSSVLSNYSEAYTAWNDAETTECPDCKGTGLDRDEIYDCETCYGEGEIVVEEPEVIAHAGNVSVDIGGPAVLDSPSWARTQEDT